MPRKPHVRPRVAVRALDRARPDELRMMIYNPHGSGPPDHVSRMVEVTVIGFDDGTMRIRLENLGDREQGHPCSVMQGAGSWVEIGVPPAP